MGHGSDPETGQTGLGRRTSSSLTRFAKYDPVVGKYVLKNAEAGVVQQHEVPIEDVCANPEKLKLPWPWTSLLANASSDKDVASLDGFRILARLYYPDRMILGDGPYGMHPNFHG
ncbi:hypothetical protein DL767_007253 [Monosporascus sp. MG133]|nr:hypothetical protein DL767_007253 [Monosporascus sp. MG133]